MTKLIDSHKLPHLLFHGPPGTGWYLCFFSCVLHYYIIYNDLGKTSTIVACAKKMYGNNYNAMTLELNASDDRGIDVVRDRIKEFAGTKMIFRYITVWFYFTFYLFYSCLPSAYLSSGIKLVILDEADAMTQDAQAALRRGLSFSYNLVFHLMNMLLYLYIVIEKYTSNTRFCLICNYVNKITPALQSRCTKFVALLIVLYCTMW